MNVLLSMFSDLFFRCCCRFDKDFHVSPFMSMKHVYDWRFTPPGRVKESGLTAQTTLLEPTEDGEKIFFDAKLMLKRYVWRAGGAEREGNGGMERVVD